MRAASAVTEFRPVPEWVYLLLASGAATLGGVAVLGSHSPLLFLVVPIAGAGFAYAARRPLLTVVLMVVVVGAAVFSSPNYVRQHKSA